MISKMRERVKNKKGFTLVELIVVLVILAILIALLVPALTGYIDKANDQKVIAEARQLLVAVQTEETKEYTEASDYQPKSAVAPTPEMYELAEVDAPATGDSTYTVVYNTSDKAKVTKLTYTKGGHIAYYDGSAWTNAVPAPPAP